MPPQPVPDRIVIAAVLINVVVDAKTKHDIVDTEFVPLLTQVDPLERTGAVSGRSVVQCNKINLIAVDLTVALETQNVCSPAPYCFPAPPAMIAADIKN